MVASEVIEAVRARVEREDGWSNILTGLGQEGRDVRRSTKFQRRTPLTREEIEAQYEEDALFARVIDAPAEHATRRWITFATADGRDADFNQRTLDYLEDLEAQSQFCDLMKYDALEGGAIMVIGANDGQAPDKPLNLDTIDTIEHLNVVSRYLVVPEFEDRVIPTRGRIEDDPMSTSFRTPKWYRFTGTNERVHPSRIIRLNGIRTTDRSQASRGGWGLQVAERVYEACRQFGTLFDYFESMFKDLSQGVFTLPGLSQLLASPNGEMLVLKRLNLVRMTASLFNGIVLDADEKYERRAAQLAGIAEGLIRCMDKLAGVTGIPLSILFGQAPTGLSTDDKSGRTTFYDGIANKQRRILRQPLNRVCEAVFAAKDGPTGGKQPPGWRYAFLPLTEPSDQEEATTDLNRAQTDQIRIERGIIEAFEARTRLLNDPRCPYSLSQDVTEAMRELDATAGETEGVIRPEPDPAPEEGPAGPAAAPAPVPGAEVPAANTALNGAQIASALDIVDRVAKGQLPRAVGVTMLQEFFNLVPARAEAIMGEVGRSFVAAAPAQQQPPPPTPAPGPPAGGD